METKRLFLLLIVGFCITIALQQYTHDFSITDLSHTVQTIDRLKRLLIGIFSGLLEQETRHTINDFIQRNYTQNCENISYELHLEQGQLWVAVQGTLIVRVSVYNCVLNVLRERLISKSNSSWDGDVGETRVIIGEKENYLRRLQNYPNDVTTLFLQWKGLKAPSWNSQTDAANILVNDYFEGTASVPFCDWWHNPSHKFLIDKYGFCNRNRTVGLQPKSLDWNHIIRQNYGGLEKLYDFFIHVVQDAAINNRGDVITSKFTIRGPSCEHHYAVEQPNDSKTYDEVFVISQYYGNEFFHRMLEDIPRLAPYLNFLREHKHVRIHMMGGRSDHTDGMINSLGIDPSRIVSGSCRARIVYLPRSTACCHPLVQESQLLSAAYRQVT